MKLKHGLCYREALQVLPPRLNSVIQLLRVTANTRAGNIMNHLLKREAYWIYILNSLVGHIPNQVSV